MYWMFFGKCKPWMAPIFALLYGLIAFSGPAHSDKPLGVDGFREAVKALQSNWPAQAIEILPVKISDPNLQPYQILIQSRALAALKKKKELVSFVENNVSVLQKLPSDHPVKIEIERLYAGGLVETNPKKAATLLGQPTQSPTEWAQAHQLFMSSKEVTKANEVARRLLLEGAASSESLEFVKTLSDKDFLRLLPKPTDRLSRLRTLLDEHVNERVLVEAISLTNFADCEVHFLEGKALRKMRRYNDALEKLRKARKLCSKDSELWMKASLLATQVHTIKRQVKSVKKIVVEMKKWAPKHSFIDDAMVQLARVHERVGRDRQARRVLRKLLEEYPEGDQANFAAWRTAYSHLRAKRYKKAAKWLKHLKGRHAPQGKYWLAKGVEVLDRQQAIKQYRRLLSEHPLTFYSWLALNRLEALDKNEARKAWSELDVTRRRIIEGADTFGETVKTKGASVLQVAIQLKELGLREEGVELTQWWAKTNKEEPQQQAAMITLNELEDYSGAQHILRWQFPKLLESNLDELSGPAWKLAYSLAYAKPIRAGAKEARLDPLFLFALSREESTFDPNIVSWAGAMGLCQLMPATGIGAYADVFRKRLTDTQKLLDPYLNARLGGFVLGQGLKKFRGNKALALAAYNAGPGYAQKTLPKKKAVPFDEWVESVGIKETRRYIKKVMQTWGRYRFLHGGENWRPEWPTQVHPRGKNSIKSSQKY